MICLECWRSIDTDPLHLDCTGDHFVPSAEADEIRDWLNGRYSFMVGTGQRSEAIQAHPLLRSARLIT